METQSTGSQLQCSVKEYSRFGAPAGKDVYGQPLYRDRESPDSFVDCSGERAIEYPKDFRSAAPLSRVVVTQNSSLVPVAWQRRPRPCSSSSPLLSRRGHEILVRLRWIYKSRCRKAKIEAARAAPPLRGEPAARKRASNFKSTLPSDLGGRHDHLCGLITRPRGAVRLISELPPPDFPGFVRRG